MERTGYTLDVTTGQRKYGGPPPEEVFQGAQPGIGTEVKLLEMLHFQVTVFERFRVIAANLLTDIE